MNWHRLPAVAVQVLDEHHQCEASFTTEPWLNKKLGANEQGNCACLPATWARTTPARVHSFMTAYPSSFARITSSSASLAPRKDVEFGM